MDFATDQYLSLPAERRQAIDERLRQLATSPTEGSVYDADTDRWTAEFADGLILFVFGGRRERIVILRVLDLG